MYAGQSVRICKSHDFNRNDSQCRCVTQYILLELLYILSEFNMWASYWIWCIILSESSQLCNISVVSTNSGLIRGFRPHTVKDNASDCKQREQFVVVMCICKSVTILYTDSHWLSVASSGFTRITAKCCSLLTWTQFTEQWCVVEVSSITAASIMRFIDFIFKDEI